MPKSSETPPSTDNAFGLLHPRVAALAKARFSEPTEIQEKAIPLAVAGENLLAIAPTGWGKMESAFLPLVGKVVSNVEKGAKEGIQLLYVTPLRALNRDMLERMQYWTHLLGLSIAVRHGDTKQSERIKQRESPPQIMVTTPESVNTLLIAPGIRDALRNVRFVVVDEVHELIDSKRGVQLGLALERLRERVKEKSEHNNFQTIGLSATVGDEESAAKFISPNTKTTRVDFKRKMELRVEYPKKPRDEKLAELWKLDDETAARLERVAKLIEQSKSVVVFVNTRSMAERLSALLFQVQELRGKVGVHHGSLAKETRIATEQEFKRAAKKGETKLKAIVATSSLELGIDVGEIDLVVQYHSPRQVTRLLQRVGRSGHRKHLVPAGVVMAVAGSDCAEAAVLAKRSLEGKLEKNRLPSNSLDVLAHQIAGIVLDKCVGENDKLETKYVFDVFRRAYHYRQLSYADFLLSAKQLAVQKLLALSSDCAFAAPSRATKLYYYENLSTIRDLRKYFVKDAEKRKNVAMLDEDFVAEYLQPGQTFIARGIPWRVLSIADDEVVVEAAQDFSAAVPDWIGEEIPVAFEAGQEFAALVEKTAKGTLGKWELQRDYACDENSASQIIEFAEEQKRFFSPLQKTLFAETDGSKTIVLHSFAGNEVNEALARAIGFLLSARLGESVRARASAYSIAVQLAKEMPLKRFVDLLAELSPTGLEKVLEAGLRHSPLFRSKFVDVAKRFGFLRRDAYLKGVSIKRLVEASADTPVWKEALNEVLGDKMDVGRAKEVIAWPVEAVVKSGLSPLATELIELYSSRELLSPAEPTQQLLEAFKKNLLAQRMALACNYCRNSFSVLLQEAPQAIACPHCKSTQATLAEYAKVIAKSDGSVLNPEERRKLGEARRVESLIASYGKKALVALATYGVGPESAGRVLARLRDDENEFYRDLLEQQKQFIATRKYWRA